MCHLAGRIDVGRYGPNFNRISFFICDYFPQEIRERGGGVPPTPAPNKDKDGMSKRESVRHQCIFPR